MGLTEFFQVPLCYWIFDFCVTGFSPAFMFFGGSDVVLPLLC